ncbi:craniofacial development protein 2-like [Aphis craccivora]|uniref:Craniofacial development protein 2-like n=1 Tax=Aphis craccivora TaxID=307492 RepID=A0A6G0Z764_APHCR|nr:craniofacial development protein 2-like [Aphis craccivora]
MPSYDLIIINCHAPTEEKEEEVKNAFYEDLERVYDTLPRHSVKLVIGDMNAKLGQEEEYKPTIGRESLHCISNDNGTRFVNFATSRDIIIKKDYKNPREFFKKCKTVRQDFKAQTYIIKDDNDDILTEPSKIELIYQIAGPELAEPDPEEINLIIKGLKNFKAPGEDEINPELLKMAGKDLKTELYLLMKDVWKNECMPKD